MDPCVNPGSYLGLFKATHPPGQWNIWLNFDPCTPLPTGPVSTRIVPWPTAVTPPHRPCVNLDRTLAYRRHPPPTGPVSTWIVPWPTAITPPPTGPVSTRIVPWPTAVTPPPPALCQPGSYLGLPPSPPPTGPVSTWIVPWATAVTPPPPHRPCVNPDRTLAYRHHPPHRPCVNLDRTLAYRRHPPPPPALCQPGSYLGLPPSHPPPTTGPVSTRIVPWPTAVTPPPSALCQPGSYLGLPPSPPPHRPCVNPDRTLAYRHHPPPTGPVSTRIVPWPTAITPPHRPCVNLDRTLAYRRRPCVNLRILAYRHHPPLTGPVSTRIVPWLTAITPPPGWRSAPQLEAWVKQTITPSKTLSPSAATEQTT